MFISMFISAAHAAETTSEGAAHAEPFYTTAEFWVAIAFLLLVLIAFRPLGKRIVKALDERAETIKSELDEAQKLREEAQDLLADAKKKQAAAGEEAKAIIKHARDEAKRMREHSAERLEESLKRREQLAMERIQQAEANAVDEIKALATDVALDAAQKVLSESLDKKKSDALVNDAIKDLPKKIH